jgi:hypothetical protein
VTAASGPDSRAPGGVVASAYLAPLVDGPVQILEVAHRGPHALQLADPHGRVVSCVINHSAVRLPYAAVVPSFPRGSSPVSVGDGSLGWNGSRFSVVRWWRPARPSLPRLSQALDGNAVDRFVERWDAGLGRGEGLTPYAVVVVCGARVVIRAAGHPAATRLASGVGDAALEHRTTATSAALIRLAAAGYCIDPLADFLTALAVSVSRVAAVADDLAVSRHRLLAVGHSSGRGLLDGVRRVLDPAVRDLPALDVAA